MSDMMNFQFETRPIRIVMGDDGQPQWIAADACAALDLGNVSMAINRLADDERGLSTVDTLNGGRQQMLTVTEAGLYRLIFTSRKPEAERFKRWVTHEVIPSIRKTGSYAAPGAPAQRMRIATSELEQKAAVCMMVGEWLAGVAGVRPATAQAATIAAIHSNTGLDVAPYRLALPAVPDEGRLNPTQIGEELGLSAVAVNKLLAARGLQARVGEGKKAKWELTEAGQDHGELVPYERNGHNALQILWKRSVIGYLGMAIDAEDDQPALPGTKGIH